MPISARYAHTNLVAQDWRRLLAFYTQVFGCTPVPPERHLTQPWVAASTGLSGAEIHGMHLRLPGYGEAGPTLEIFQYNLSEAKPATAPNRPGYGHLAFAVEDVAAARDAVLAAGGRAVGDLVHVQVPGAGPLTFVYVTDPEGNIIELQRWSH
jgi:catechol 2,3-dioxygenase-like lactoylglutathione lyase family enzyme